MRVQKVLIFLLSVMVSKMAFAQCSISARRNACVNDLVNFSIINGSGSAVTSYSWNFGTYGTSSTASPVQKFTAAGKLTVSCTISLSSGSTCTDTHTIVIHPNPKAIIQLDNSNEYCLGKNKVCFQNNSTPAVAPLASLTVLWGDGGITAAKSPLAYRFCYTYKDTGTFKISAELADSFGCKDVAEVKVRIKPEITIKPSYQITNYCDSIKICFNDNASGPGTPYSRKWIDDSNGKVVSRANPFCMIVKPGTAVYMGIETTNVHGCSVEDKVYLFAPENKISVGNLQATYCMNTILSGQVTLVANESVNWNINGTNAGRSSFLKLTSAKEGWNKVTISQTTPCPLTWTDSFRVFTVRAAGAVYNENRHKVVDTVFFLDLTKRPSGSRLSKLWWFGDNTAPACTTSRYPAMNFQTNCNYSRDTLARHFYHQPDCYTARLMVFDSATGCYDDTLFFIFRTESCEKIISQSSICAGEGVDFKLSRATWLKIFRNNFLYTDLKPPKDSLVLSNVPIRWYYPNPGVYSPVLWRFYSHDTVWKDAGLKIAYDSLRKGRGWVADTFKNAITVNEKPVLKIKAGFGKTCDPVTAIITFTDSILRFPVELRVNWGDTMIQYTVKPDSNFIQSPLYHHYKNPGIYKCTVTVKNKYNCETSVQGVFPVGQQMDFNYLYSCSSPMVCFRDSVFQYEGNVRWNSASRQGELIWDFGDGHKDTGFMPCHTYALPGEYDVQITAVDKNGCKQSFKKKIKIARPRAGIKIPGLVYCSEIRQYFDSSEISGGIGKDSIISWNWDFGDGTKPKTVKNPAHIFPGGGIYTITLTIKTALGCTDSEQVTIPVFGPEVSALILTDSIGCAPLKVNFGNRSKNTGNYIWEYGDPNNSFESTDQDTNMSFTYSKPGRYYAHLTGGDSFYNATTGSTYYCSVRFPAPGAPQMRITVLPVTKVRFSGPDTICLTDTAEFFNHSGSAGHDYRWQFSDSQFVTSDTVSLRRQFPRNGTYSIKLWPDFSGGAGCFDTAYDSVTVVSVQPSFEYDCEDLTGPVIELKNTSNLPSDNFRWFSLDPSTGKEDNLYLGRNLIFKTGNDTGLRNICLALNTGGYCAVKYCRTVYLKAGVALANVFTPGNDGFNDTYRVPLYGYEKFDLRIFNRWGERVFYSENPGFEWNGKVQNSGPELPEGTYFYTLRFKEPCSGKMKEVNGSVNLIR